MLKKNTKDKKIVLTYEYWVRYETVAGGGGWTIINTPPLKREEHTEGKNYLTTAPE